MNIKDLEKLKDRLQYSLEIDSDCCLLEEDKQAIIETLEKQISRKPDCEDEYDCPVCNSAIDEADAGGLWDLAAEICDSIFGRYEYCDEQDTVYGCLRDWIERQSYCPLCGQALL